MKTSTQITMLILATGCAAALIAPGLAQVSADFSNDKIVLYEHEKGDRGYWKYTLPDPNDSDKAKQTFQPIDKSRVATRDAMMKRRVLEEYAEFLSPLRLPRTYRIFASDCSGGNAESPYYDSSQFHRWMNMCYSFVAFADKAADYLVQNQAKLKLWTPVSMDQLVAGLFAATVLHETGHALFDQLTVPVFGREEDAADQIAAFVALQFGTDTARTIVKGFAYFWAYEMKFGADPGGHTMDPKDPKYPKDPDQQCNLDAFCSFSDVHGTASQRMYNTLCIAYGGNKAAFQDFVNSKWLPPERAKNCEAEYRQAYNAFAKTIYPFIDQAKMEKVMKRAWFQPKETKEK
jgi:hypothetical protein